MANSNHNSRRETEEDEDNEGLPARQSRKRAADAAVNQSDSKPPKKRGGVSTNPLTNNLVTNASYSQRRRQ